MSWLIFPAQADSPSLAGFGGRSRSRLVRISRFCQQWREILPLELISKVPPADIHPQQEEVSMLSSCSIQGLRNAENAA